MNFKIIRDSRENIGAPAKTDFVRIYIDTDVSDVEYQVLLKHEQSHIWLEHNKRYVKGMKRKEWEVATEMEIARNIYTQDDIDVIKAPMSMISGGYVPDSIPEMPRDIILAEQIYDWLINNKKECEDSKTCDCSDHKNEGADEAMQQEAVQALIEKTKELIEAAIRSKVAQKSLLDNLSEIKTRKPTLVSEMDSILRKRHERERTYRRAARSSSEGLIMKGRMTFARPPFVEIFIDRSGSFTPEKTANAQKALTDILAKYNSSVRNDVWFFGSGRISSKDFSGGDTPYHLIIEHIKKTNPKIAVVVTDDDSCCDFTDLPENTKILVVPIHCNETEFSKKTGGIEVAI